VTALSLTRPMASTAVPTWAGALWVGTVDVADLARPDVDDLRLVDADGHPAARLLVRDGREVLGFVEAPVVGGHVSIDLVRSEAADLPTAPRAAVEPSDALPTVTVVVCSRDRAEQLRGCLRSVLALDHPAFDVVVVDNAPSTTATRDLVAGEFDDPRVRYVVEPVAGLSSARNAGLRAATGEVVAFTDDDVVVDAGWLRGLCDGFARADDVACVTGLVPSGELRTPVQRSFDDRVSWSRNVAPRVFRLDEQPADLPTFPFSVGAFGTGADFALRRDVALALGGFDTAFGVGTRTAGGEDLDVFTRVLFAGHALAVQPSALVWHRHRADLAALRVQAAGYGTGLGAWLAGVALDGRTRRAALRRAPHAVAALLAKGRAGSAPVATSRVSTAPADVELDRELRRTARVELAGIARGPLLYLRQRWDGASTMRPVRPPVAAASSTLAPSPSPSPSPTSVPAAVPVPTAAGAAS